MEYMKKALKPSLSRFLRSIPKKVYKEVSIAVGIFIAAGLLVTLISPYSPAKNAVFYDDNGQSGISLYRATVKDVSSTLLTVTMNDGASKGQTISMEYALQGTGRSVAPGDVILVGNSEIGTGIFFVDRFRIPALIMLSVVFALVVLLIGRRKGLRSLIGLFASILVILFILVPLVIKGFDAFYVSVLSALLIALLTTVVSQGFTRRAAIMLISMGIILLFAAICSALIVNAMGLSGLVDEVSYHISLTNSAISLSGLVSGGILIATLGALDDIVATQVATVDELMKTDAKMSRKELFVRASRVGSEHIASLVNTLALVYVGAALPIIVSNALGSMDLLLLFNNEFAATEIVRTMIISIALVLAVPISTLIAVRMFKKARRKKVAVKAAS